MKRSNTLPAIPLPSRRRKPSRRTLSIPSSYVPPKPSRSGIGADVEQMDETREAVYCEMAWCYPAVRDYVHSTLTETERASLLKIVGEEVLTPWDKVAWEKMPQVCTSHTEVMAMANLCFSVLRRMHWGPYSQDG